MEKTLQAILDAAGERGLPFLLIGGNAVILLGYLRNTLDIDLLVQAEKRSVWLDLMRDLGFRFFHGQNAFAQFEAANAENAPVDLMFVDSPTWEHLQAEARPAQAAGRDLRIPRPEHLVALKLHAAASPTRSKPSEDWEDIRQIVRCCQLDPEEEYLKQIILRYGGEDALKKIRLMRL